MRSDIKELGNRKYQTTVRLEETTDGSYCYVAFHPELPGCMSQGTTPEEAEANLHEATEMVIEHLVSNGLPVPDPAPLFSFPSKSFPEYSETIKLVAPSMEMRPIAVPA